jgi:glycosyltransferase involved in cell wall biosynthesis
MKKLSIVIPTKNEERYLPLLLEEISTQTVQPYEVIVADANSTDRTREIAEAFGAKVVMGGLPAVGRNHGADAAKGELIFFFDADVLLRDSRFLERAVAEFESSHLDIATADVGVVDGTLFDDFAHAFYNVYVRLVNRVHPHAPGFCILVRAQLHREIHGFDEQVLFCEDHDYAIRASQHGAFGLLDSVKIFATTRRQERDGRIAMAVKYFFAELHIFFIGPIRHDKFKYGFGYEEKK